jgi:precorrin-3B C17-methyltransferase
MNEAENSAKGILYLVGIGPGAKDHCTPAALAAIADADLVVGYSTYIALVRDLLEGKEIVRSGMTEEIGRARAAVERARAGAKVALISSGDAGVYGMAGLVFEVLREINWKRTDSPELRIVPGITAISSCASLLGAPLVHDFCAISLSDLLTPWAVIERRIEAAAGADFVIGLYNPASGRRTRQIVEAHDIIARYRKGTTPVGLVKSGYRSIQKVVLTDLDHFLDYEIGMLTTVVVGSSNTFTFEGYMVTPRGYTNKYNWDGTVLPGQKPARSLVVESAASIVECEEPE